MDINNYINT